MHFEYKTQATDIVVAVDGVDKYLITALPNQEGWVKLLLRFGEPKPTQLLRSASRSDLVSRVTEGFLSAGRSLVYQHGIVLAAYGLDINELEAVTLEAATDGPPSVPNALLRDARTHTPIMQKPANASLAPKSAQEMPSDSLGIPGLSANFGDKVIWVPFEKQ